MSSLARGVYWRLPSTGVKWANTCHPWSVILVRPALARPAQTGETFQKETSSTSFLASSRELIRALSSINPRDTLAETCDDRGALK